MKSIIIKSMALFVVITVVAAFTFNPGGEGFEILVNNQVVIQQYGNDMNTVKSLRLNQNSKGGKLGIKYFHCGKVGNNRIVTIKNGQHKILKEFRYADATTPVSAMTLNIKELFNLKSGNGNTLKLYYASSELVNGRLLATILIPDDVSK